MDRTWDITYQWLLLIKSQSNALEINTENIAIREEKVNRARAQGEGWGRTEARVTEPAAAREGVRTPEHLVEGGDNGYSATCDMKGTETGFVKLLPFPLVPRTTPR